MAWKRKKLNTGLCNRLPLVPSFSLCKVTDTSGFRPWFHVLTHCKALHPRHFTIHNAFVPFNVGMMVAITLQLRVCGGYVVAFVNCITSIEWCMARFVFKNGHPKDTC